VDYNKIPPSIIQKNFGTSVKTLFDLQELMIKDIYENKKISKKAKESWKTLTKNQTVPDWVSRESLKDENKSENVTPSWLITPTLELRSKGRKKKQSSRNLQTPKELFQLLEELENPALIKHAYLS
jgi:hypothetical protein